MKRPHFFLSVAYLSCLTLIMSSCGAYKQNIMFKMPEDGSLRSVASKTEKNYVIQKHDLLGLEVYTHKGEKLVDPQDFVSKDVSMVTPEASETRSYLVTNDGLIKLPLVGLMKLEGLTILQAEEILEKEYSKFFEEPFVVLKYNSKRVIVLGAPGGQVIPLVHENTSLVEVLALAKGVNHDAKAHNIRVLRGDKAFVADLSTFDGYLKNNMTVEPGDIIYVEPIRRPFVEGIRDYGPVFTMLASLATLVIIITGR